MKLKSAFTTIMISVSALTVIAYTALTRIEYIPGDAVSFSNRYLSLLTEGKAAEAYELTEKNAVTGFTFESFRGKINRECVRHGVTAGKKAVLMNILPRQTYGNRLRRLLNGRDPDARIVSIDYHVGTIPFEIRLARYDNGGFAVTNFQSHAE